MQTAAANVPWYRSIWSPEVRALARPYRTFAALVADADAAAPARTTAGAKLALALRRPLLLLLLIAVFVSFTASGRLVLGHVAWAMIGWSFLPLLELFGLVGGLALFARPRLRMLPYMIDTSFVARAPWLVYLALFTVVHVVAADPRASFFSVFLTRPMMIALAACMVATRVLDHAFWRALGLGRWRALLALVVVDVLVFAPGIAWFLATEQLQPLFAGAS